MTHSRLLRKGKLTAIHTRSFSIKTINIFLHSLRNLEISLLTISSHHLRSTIVLAPTEPTLLELNRRWLSFKVKSNSLKMFTAAPSTLSGLNINCVRLVIKLDTSLYMKGTTGSSL